MRPHIVVRPGFDMTQNTSRAEWIMPELKSVEIATTETKTAPFPSELGGFGVPSGPGS